MHLAECWQDELLADEPFCDEAHDEAEVIYAGSEDEHYYNPQERRRRIEAAAHRFLEGHTPILLTAVLRGPFEGPGANGWVNPWRSKSKSLLVAPAPATAFATTDAELAETDVSDAESTISCHLPSPRSLDQAGDFPHPLMREEDLQRVQSWRNATESAEQVDDEYTWSFASDISLSQSRSHRKRRSMASDRFKLHGVKRRKAEHEENVEGTPMVAQLHTQRVARSRSNSQQKRSRDNLLDGSVQDVPITQRQTCSSQQSSQNAPEAPQKQSPQTPVKAAHVPKDHTPAPFSTPIQTPRSAVIQARATPRTNEPDQQHYASEADIGTNKSRESSEANVEFETQEDESFLFRARPRSRGLEAAAVAMVDNHQTETFSSSSALSDAESESDDEDAMELGGDTCLADDTKATSPESNSEPKNPEDEVTIEHDASKATDQLKATDAADLANSQHRQKNIQTEEESISASQERTIVAQPGSSMEKTSQSMERNQVSTPVAPKDDQIKTGQSIEAPSLSRQEPLVNSLAELVCQQSPWSKSDLSFASSPCPVPSFKSKNRVTETPVDQQTYRLETPVIPGDRFRATPTASETPVAMNPYAVETVQIDGAQRREVTSGKPHGEEAVDQQESSAISASQQSPWKADVTSVALPRALGVVEEASRESSIDPSCQSPWTASPYALRLAAQQALMFSVFNTSKPVSQSTVASSIPGDLDTPKTDMSTLQKAPTPVDVTPEPVFEIKRFSNLMSPSPERRKRKSNRGRLSGGQLPSTQNLLAATTDNPWNATQRPSKRVRWVPELEAVEDLDGGGPMTPLVTRAASPPPDLTVADLPIDKKDKFHDHFQAVSRRTKVTERLLPSASQQILESPAPMAMAEAFVHADSFGLKAPRALVALRVVDDATLLPHEDSRESVDDVDEVLLNLNEFINMVDVEADLARAKEEDRKEQEKKQKQQQKTESTSSGLFGNLSFSGLMDAGVWDS